jgi:hypothetical protein
VRRLILALTVVFTVGCTQSEDSGLVTLAQPPRQRLHVREGKAVRLTIAKPPPPPPPPPPNGGGGA